MPSVRLWFKKRMVVSHLNASQQSMFRLGTVGLAAVKKRVQEARGPDDSAAKPLTRHYAIRKSKRGLGNRRNLTYSGDMLRNLSLRSVAENKATASLTSRKDRLKAIANKAIQPWLVFSPQNRQAVMAAARQILADMKPRLLIEKALGKQR